MCSSHTISRQSKAEDPYLPLRAALFQARDSVSSDLRDKIFAMLPLIHPEKTHMVADYRKPYHEVYKAAALELALTSLNFLSACQFTDRLQTLPSWVPDMSKPWRFLPLLQSFDSDHVLKRPNDFRSEPPETECIIEEGLLKTRGIITDEVKIVHASYASSSSTNDELNALREEWLTFSQHRSVPWNPQGGIGHLSYDSRHSTVDEVGDLGSNGDLDPQQNLQSRRPVVDASEKAHVPYTSNKYFYSASFQPRLASPVTLAIKRAFLHYLVTGYVDDQLDDDNNLSAARALLIGRRFARTSQGAFGFLPDSTRIGDRICHFQGSILTFVIRQSQERPGHWVIIGDAYFRKDIDPLGGNPEPTLQDIALI